MKHYVVWVGRKPGIYESWPEAEAQVRGFPGAQFKSYPDRQTAEVAFEAGPPRPIKTTAKGESKPQHHLNTSKKIPRASERPVQQPLEQRFDVAIYSDGACEPNPGQAGCGLAIYRNGTLVDAWSGGFVEEGTNNYAELTALHKALDLSKNALNEGHSVAIGCDSTYAINAVTIWAKTWKKNGWAKKGGPIKNLDLIKAVHELFLEVEEKVVVEHVQSHAGIEGNEIADRMAMRAIRMKTTSLAPYEGPLDVRMILAMASG